MLESGAVSPKNEVNIMVKNTLDVVFGGITYWAFGFGLSFGEGPGTNPFVGVGCFLFDSSDSDTMGYSFSLFLFQVNQNSILCDSSLTSISRVNCPNYHWPFRHDTAVVCPKLSRVYNPSPYLDGFENSRPP